MSTPVPASQASIDRLCPACGLCCNGVLFGDVELQKTDHPEQLTALGLELYRKGRKVVFGQPCACFSGQACRIYPDRPNRCRTFECRVLKRFEGGQLSGPGALKLIDAARRQAEVVRGLLRQLGNDAENLPLSRRFAAIMAQPINLATDDDMVERRAQLMLEVEKLMTMLHREFLSL
jgi:uncharacterized protein